MDLQFSLDLLGNATLYQLPFVKDLDCNNQLGFLFSCQVNMSELAPTQRLSKLEVFDRPEIGIKLLHYNVILLVIEALLLFIYKCNVVWNFYLAILPWLIYGTMLINIESL